MNAKKRGLTFYRKDFAYRMLKKDMTTRYGREQTERIWETAGCELEELWGRFDDVPKAERTHTHGEIFPRVAMYRALQREMPERAIEVMDDAIKLTGTKIGKLIGALTALPGMPRVFLCIMRVMTQRLFGEAAGFEQRFYQTGRGEYRFDITECPYCKYCALCGCPELTRNFCLSDEYCYGNLPGICFERTNTLGMGGTCCDFRFAIDRRKKDGAS